MCTFRVSVISCTRIFLIVSRFNKVCLQKILVILTEFANKIYLKSLQFFHAHSVKSILNSVYFVFEKEEQQKDSVNFCYDFLCLFNASKEIMKKLG